MAQGPTRKKCHLAVIVLFDRLTHSPTQSRAVIQIMRLAQSGNRHHFEMLVFVHVAQWHQGAIFGRECGVVMRQSFYAKRVTDFRQQLP